MSSVHTSNPSKLLYSISDYDNGSQSPIRKNAYLKTLARKSRLPRERIPILSIKKHIEKQSFGSLYNNINAQSSNRSMDKHNKSMIEEYTSDKIKLNIGEL